MNLCPTHLDLGLPAPFHAVCSTRAGGVSAAPWDTQNHGLSTGDSAADVERNHALLAAACGAPGPWARLSQVHGAVILKAEEPGVLGQADGLWTDRPGLTLAIRVADCAAVAVAHPGSGRVGLVHAGWRGAAAGAVAALIRAIDAPPGECWAGVSPHLGPCCFEVGPDVVEAFGGRFTRPRASDRSTLDLGAALRTQLLETGVAAERIREAGLCTACEARLFFSHRRDRGRTGRMAVLGWIGG